MYTYVFIKIQLLALYACFRFFFSSAYLHACFANFTRYNFSSLHGRNIPSTILLHKRRDLPTVCAVCEITTHDDTYYARADRVRGRPYGRGRRGHADEIGWSGDTFSLRTPAACHTGAFSCFRLLTSDASKIVKPRAGWPYNRVVRKVLKQTKHRSLHIVFGRARLRSDTRGVCTDVDAWSVDRKNEVVGTRLVDETG